MSTHPTLLARLLLMAVIIIPAALHADIAINGFVSAGGGKASYDSEREDPVNGYDEDWSFSADTILGIQISGPINDKLTATGQIIAEGSSDYDAEVSWAYLTYEFDDAFTGRIGRFRTPFYLYSDYLDVGYAYHWIRPPGTVYSLPFNSIDGVDVVYRSLLGDWESLVQFYLGSLDDEFIQLDFALKTKIRNQYGIAWNMTYDWLTLRASVHQADVSFSNLDELVIDPDTDTTVGDLRDNLDTVAQIPLLTAVATNAARNLAVDETQFTFYQLGARAEWENILFVTEVTRLEPDDGPTAEQKRWYASLGYRFGKFMPHLTVAEADDDSAVIPTTGLPGPLPEAIDGITEGFTSDRQSTIVGLRYDFADGAALKVEWEKFDDDINGDGKLISFAIDAVF